MNIKCRPPARPINGMYIISKRIYGMTFCRRSDRRFLRGSVTTLLAHVLRATDQGDDGKISPAANSPSDFFYVVAPFCISFADGGRAAKSPIGKQRKDGAVEWN